MRYPELLSRPSRFTACPPAVAACVLALFLALCLWGVAARPPVVGASSGPQKPFVGAVAASDPAGDDILLYRSIVAGVRGGGNYYAVTAPLLRDNDYPLRPFVTFRLPTLALLLAAIPDFMAVGIMALLAGSVIVAWTVRLAPALRTPEIASWTSLMLLAGCLTPASPSLIVFHESWAALLLALALALHRPERAPQRWWPSVIVALAAVLIRELALPFVLLMGALAFHNRRWSEGAAWSSVVAIFAVALTLHAQQVALVTYASDPASPGWSSMGGWPFLIAAVRATTIFMYLPAFAAALVVPLSLLGWAAWRNATGLATFLFLTGFGFMMTLVGRPDNFYWAVMIDPVLLPGLIFAPAALRDLAHAAMPRSRPLRSA